MFGVRGDIVPCGGCELLRHHPSSITSTSDIVMLAHAGHGREFLAGRTGEVTLTRGSELAGDRAPKISFLSLHLSASLAQKTITYSRYLLSILDTDTLFD